MINLAEVKRPLRQSRIVKSLESFDTLFFITLYIDKLGACNYNFVCNTCMKTFYVLLGMSTTHLSAINSAFNTHILKGHNDISSS